MKWQFNLSEGSKNINLNAEIVFTSYQIEEIKVTGNEISLLLLNNRPLLEAIELRQPLSWRVISGGVKDQNLLARIQKELEKHLTKPAEAATFATATKPAIAMKPVETAKPAAAKPVTVSQPAVVLTPGRSNKEAGKKFAKA